MLFTTFGNPSHKTLIRYLVSTSGKGANLLLNVGPQPNGKIPATALDRLREIGEWTSRYGETIYGTVAGDIPVQEWGVTTRKGNRLFVHIFDHQEKSLTLPLQSKVKKAFVYDTKQTLKTKRTEEGVTIFFDEVPSGTDYIVELEMRD
jgi:alpha-L-fucosidase